MLSVSLRKPQADFVSKEVGGRQWPEDDAGEQT